MVEFLAGARVTANKRTVLATTPSKCLSTVFASYLLVVIGAESRIIDTVGSIEQWNLTHFAEWSSFWLGLVIDFREINIRFELVVINYSWKEHLGNTLQVGPLGMKDLPSGGCQRIVNSNLQVR